MKSKVYFLSVILVLSGMTGLQANNRKANRYFNMYKYSLAIPLYKKSVNSSDEKIKREAIERLGDCYRFTNNVLEEQSWYSRAVEYQDADPVLYFYLGQSYQCTEQYDKARKAFLQYAALNPSDPRGKILAAHCDSIGLLTGYQPSAEIRNVSSINTEYSEFGPVFYKDGIIFVSDRKYGYADEMTFDWTNRSYYDLFFSQPKYYRNYWQDLAKSNKMSVEFNQSFHDGPVCFTSDFGTVYLTRTLENKVTKDNENFKTHRLQIRSAYLKNGKKPDFRPVPFNNDNYSVGHPTVSLDGNYMIFSSDMPGGQGGSDLYYVEFRQNKWSQPQNLGPGINTFGNEEFPCLVNDTILYYSSDGLPGYGGLDVFESRRSGGSWGKPLNLLKPLNSSYDDFSIVFNQDRVSGFFSSDRPGGKGSDDIYAFREFRKPEKRKTVRQLVTDEVRKQETMKTTKACGSVLEKGTRKPVANATVFLFNIGSGEVYITTTDSSGQYNVPVEVKTDYIVKGMKESYFDDCLSFSFGTVGKEACQPVPQSLLLDRYELNQTFVMHNILYDLDKWNVRPDAEATLNELVRIMQQYPISIELSSHTDSRASDAYNLLLSLRRAQAAKDYIVNRGINPSRITAMGYGETRPVNRCANGVTCYETEHQANRRTEFRIISLSSPEFGKKPLDLNSYKDGDKLTIDRFEPGFFWKCLVPAAVPAVSQDALQVNPGVVRKDPSAGVTGNQGQPSADLPGETFFTVQVAAALTSKGDAVKDFRGENVFTGKVAGYTKYYVGKFTGYGAALAEKSRLSAIFPGAFIVAFKDGVIVPVSELKAILK